MLCFIRSKKDGPLDAFKKSSSLDKRLRARLPGVDCHHCHLRPFRGVRLYERLGSNLQRIVPVFPNCFFPLCFPPSITPNLRQPWFCHEKKKRGFCSNQGKTGIGDPSNKTLALPAFSRHWHRASFCHKTP